MIICNLFSTVYIVGCSKCDKLFTLESFGDPADCSGFETEQWNDRKVEDHRKYGHLHNTANSRKEQESIEQNYGVRYTELNRLSYFNVVRIHVVDVMHAIFLGTTKKVFKTWIEIGVLDEK